MKKLLLLFPLLFGCALNKPSVYDRYLFIRNGLPDTLQIQLLSPDSKGRASIRVAPADSTCLQYPFQKVRGVLVASTKDDLRLYNKFIDGPGLDWFLVGGNQEQPSLGSCLGG